MIVTHHPLLFSGIEKLTDEDPAGRLIRQLVQHDIAVYSCHTPFDKTKGGNNDVLAGVLKLSNVRNLGRRKGGISRGYGDAQGGSGYWKMRRIQTADQCRRTGGASQRRSWYSSGIDTYRDRRSRRSRWIGTAFRKAGLCTGAGADLLPMAQKLGCDVFVTGDVKYHEAQAAATYGICLIDAGHYGTEKLFGKTMQSILTSMLPARVEVLASGVDLDPFQLG